MPINANEKGKKPSIHITEDDAENAEKLGKGDNSPSSVYSEALEQATQFDELQEEKAQELQKTLNEVQEAAERWGITDLRFNL